VRKKTGKNSIFNLVKINNQNEIFILNSKQNANINKAMKFIIPIVNMALFRLNLQALLIMMNQLGYFANNI